MALSSTDLTEHRGKTRSAARSQARPAPRTRCPGLTPCPGCPYSLEQIVSAARRTGFREHPRAEDRLRRCGSAFGACSSCGCGFDPLFEFGHQPAARPAGRDRIEKFEGDAAGPLPETAPAPEQAGIDRRRNQRQGQCLVQPVDAGLIGRRRAWRDACPLRIDHDWASLGCDLACGGEHRAARLPLQPCGRLRWRRRGPCTSHKTGRAAAPF